MMSKWAIPGTRLIMLSFAAVSLVGCGEAAYTGPTGPPDEISKIETRLHHSLRTGNVTPTEFRILSVDGVPWGHVGNDSGVKRGTLAPGYHNIKFVFKASRCTTTAAGVAGTVAASFVEAMLTDELRWGCAGRRVVFSREGIVSLIATPKASYLMVPEVAGSYLEVFVLDKATNRLVTGRRRFDFPTYAP